MCAWTHIYIYSSIADIYIYRIAWSHVLLSFLLKKRKMILREMFLVLPICHENEQFMRFFFLS